MSDHDAAPDPVDRAYVQAETMLSDDQARAARRARVLAAAAQEPPATPAVDPRAVRRPVWRHGRWLAAAGVAGLAVLIASHIYAPVVRQPQTAPAAVSAGPTSAAPAAPTPAAPAPPAGAPAPGPRAAAVARAPSAPRTATVPTVDIAPPLPPPSPPPPPSLASAPQAFPAAAAPAPPPMPNAAVTAERRASDATSAFAAPPAALSARSESSGGLAPDRPAALRAAAAAGRAADVQALLHQGVPVDAPDADGETALMKSIQADRPQVAGLLRRHGASLDRKNDAGESARDMAAAKGDAALDRALGLGP
jgi:hypothetical protein